MPIFIKKTMFDAIYSHLKPSLGHSILERNRDPRLQQNLEAIGFVLEGPTFREDLSLKLIV